MDKRTRRLRKAAARWLTLTEKEQIEAIRECVTAHRDLFLMLPDTGIVRREDFNNASPAKQAEMLRQKFNQ
jgi:hypothetical protein